MTDTDHRRPAAPLPLYRGRPISRMHVMVKPTGPLCNLSCQYCYYLHKQDLLATASRWRISDETLETFIRQYMEGQNVHEVVFTWQGGEPTLLGLDFFRKVVALEQKYRPGHVRCENDLQTNGTLLDDRWCAFLAENRFFVGLSIDGPRALHDGCRKDRSGQGSFDRVWNAARLLKKHGVPFATLSCVSRETAKHPLEVYRFLRDVVQSPRIQFIPVVEPKLFREAAPPCRPKDGALPRIGTPAARPGTAGSVVEDWSVDPEDWGEFLCRVFDDWLKNGIGAIYVHYFEAAVETWMGRVNPLCTHAPICGKGLAMEHDGSLYACDHYVYPSHKLGNIRERTLAEMAFSPEQEWFGKSKEGHLPQYCLDCPYLFACFGECPKNRIILTPDDQPGLNYLCRGWRAFFAHIDPHMRTIVRQLGYMPVKGLTGETFNDG